MSSLADEQASIARSGLIAVTGASGFIGRHVGATLAARGWKLRFLIRGMSPLPPLPRGVELVLGDLDDASSLRSLVSGADVVVHLAGAIKARNSAEFDRVNSQGTRRLAEACAASGTVRMLVALSSLAARLPEISPYAMSKREGELRLIESGLPAWMAIRAPVVYGAADRETLALFRLANRGLAPVAAGIDARLSLIHASDLARVIADCIEHPPPSDIYEIDDGTADGYRLRDVLALAAALLGRRVRTIAVPRLAMLAAAAVAQGLASLTGRSAILTAGKVREMFHPDWVVRDRRLGAHLSFQPEFDLRRGFQDTIFWYREHNWL